MKFVYCGYDFFWNVLQRILDGNHELLSLYTFRTDNQYDFNTRVTALAQVAHAPVQRTPITEQSLTKIARSDRQLLICAAYPYKIPAEIIATFDYAINVHPSLLPQGRGPWPMPWSILRGDATTGITMHKLDPHWDRGDILSQTSLAIAANENLESLSAKLQLAAAPLVGEFIDHPDELWRKATPQGDGRYDSWPKDAERTINWNSDVMHIDRVVRAFGKFESYAWIQRKKYFVRDATVWQQKHGYTPGTVVHEMNRELVIAARDGFVCLRNFVAAPAKS